MPCTVRPFGVEAISLYHHVRGSDDLLDGMVDTVSSEIALPSADDDRREAMRRRAHSVREVLPATRSLTRSGSGSR